MENDRNEIETRAKEIERNLANLKQRINKLISANEATATLQLQRESKSRKVQIIENYIGKI